MHDARIRCGHVWLRCMHARMNMYELTRDHELQIPVLFSHVGHGGIIGHLAAGAQITD